MKSALTVLVLGFLTFNVALKSVLAATVSGSFGVSATVPATCQASASFLRLGAYSGATANATSDVSMNCTNATTYDVSLRAGSAPSAIAVSQKMTALGPVLHFYVLTSNNQASANTTHEVESDSVAGVENGAPQAITVRGQTTARHSVAAEVYPDSIFVTVTY